MRNLRVCLTSDLFHHYDEGNKLVVVVDILRATSVISTAFMEGVKAIIPVKTLEEALEYKGKEGYIIAAERNAKKPETKTQNVEAWRRGRFENSNNLQVQAALQKAERARKRKNYLKTGKRSFSTKRQHQSSQWRKNRSPAAFR